ncbi:alpha/beta fold hydrolase [Achromobacter insuavis]
MAGLQVRAPRRSRAPGLCRRAGPLAGRCAAGDGADAGRRHPCAGVRPRGRAAAGAAAWRAEHGGQLAAAGRGLGAAFPHLRDRPDRRGRPSAPARLPLASDAHAAWLEAVLDSLGVARAACFGISLGAWLALDFAVRRPARVERLALLCPSGIGRQKNILPWVLPLLLLRPRAARWCVAASSGRCRPIRRPPTAPSSR